jgi:hypothetical protein
MVVEVRLCIGFARVYLFVETANRSSLTFEVSMKVRCLEFQVSMRMNTCIPSRVRKAESHKIITINEPTADPRTITFSPNG